MIRGAILFLALIFASAFPAFSEDTYYLVDNSGSMTQYREGEDGVDREIEELVRRSSAGSAIYVSYFRGNTVSDCESPVSLPDEPVVASESFTLDPGRAGGSTLIVKAISALYGIEEDSYADVVLYTDGSFEGNDCETPQQICEALLKLQQDRPRLRFKFEAPRSMRIRGEPVLSCAGMGPFDRASEAEVGSGGDGDSGIDAGDRDSVGIIWPPLIALLVLPIFLIVPFVINILSIRRFTVGIETADGIFDPNKQRTLGEIWAFVVSAVVIFVTGTIIVAYYLLVPGARDTHVHWFDAANRPLLSILYAYAYTVVLGWHFVEKMRDSHARKQNEWKVSYQEAVRQFEVSEVSRIQVVYATARRDQDQYESRKISTALSQIEAAGGDDVESVQTQISDLSNHIQTIKARIERALGKVTSYQELKDYQNASFSDYDSVAELLVSSGKIDKDLSRNIKRVFEAWSNLLERLPRIDTQLKRTILDFDISVFDADVEPHVDP